ncbi:MAG: DAK2 domain-containing protein [Ardenticatenaceae bacterium]|nr:DAK2 domain-containing protein [Ardenticatenaceae bacterium]
MTKISGAPWHTCNGLTYKKLVQAGLYVLEQNHHTVNALNVFPVPDGDTGTNMLLTMRSAWRAIKDADESHVGAVAQAFSRGALMGARGNSGVILSQIWRGIGRSLAEKEAFEADDLADALQAAVETAYGGVMKPVEGTILTVIREGAAEAVDAADKSDDIRFVLRRTLTRSRQSLERTPELLPILKQAGVVDSGGMGLVFILEGMYKLATGELEGIDEAAGSTFEAQVASLPAQAHAVPEGGVLENHYDVQFILMGENLNVEVVRNTIDAMGDSTVVVGDETTIKVHVHVDNPGEPLSYGISLGEITDVVVENMQMQMEEIVTAGAPPAAPSAQELAQKIQIEPGQIAVVTVAPGSGFETLFQDLGASGIVPGGQTNNPSTEELFAAIEAVDTDKVILLPNNKNIILASEAARDLADKKQVVVVPTRTVPQGIAAMLALDPAGEIEAVGEAMMAMAADVVTVQVTVATRSVQLNGVAVAEGDIIGLVDGEIVASGQNIVAVLKEAMAAVEDIDEREIVSLFYGEDTTADEAQKTAETIEEWYEELEVEVQPGGQAHYFYILGVE